MKYLLTLVPMTRETRRRAGKSYTEVVDTEREPYAEDVKHLTTAMHPAYSEVEAVELLREEYSRRSDTVQMLKVIDVRPLDTVDETHTGVL